MPKTAKKKEDAHVQQSKSFTSVIFCL